MKNYENPFVERKRKNIDLTLKIIQDNKEIKYNKLIAMLEFQGIGTDTAKKYVKTLVNLESIKIDDGIIKETKLKK